MERVIVVTDSTAGVPADLVARHGLHIIPPWVHSGEQSYRDGVDLTPEQFYPLLARAPDLPTISHPSAGEFLERCAGWSSDCPVSERNYPMKRKVEATRR